MTQRTKSVVLAEIEKAMTALSRGPRIKRLHQFLNLKAGGTLDRPAYVTLDCLEECGPMRISELAKACGVDVSTVSRLVDHLSATGLVEPGGESHDGRVVILRVSDGGKKLLRRLKAVRRDALVRLLSDWPEEDQEAFARLLSRFVESLERLTSWREL